ncbi:MAG TPA: methyltransferase domain-containing protein [Gaiellaceae bacterium]|nr:methyltransferase domain-containing protein [Gaiellaceae bacterium]
MSDRATRSRSFETVAAEYERWRPDYPEAALRWAADTLALAPGARVLDVGAGTGKLTRGLVALGFDAVAVEPGGPMLEQLVQAVPAAEAHQAPAEAIPLADESVGAAFAGQAYHWFDRERALPELHRVLRPGGGIALLWNWWDERHPLQRELGQLVGYAGHEPYVEAELPGEPWFAEVGRAVIETGGETTADALVGHLATASGFLVVDPAEREEALQAVRDLAARYGDPFPFPRLTYVFAFRRHDA